MSLKEISSSIKRKKHEAPRGTGESEKCKGKEVEDLERKNEEEDATPENRNARLARKKRELKRQREIERKQPLDYNN